MHFVQKKHLFVLCFSYRRTTFFAFWTEEKLFVLCISYRKTTFCFVHFVRKTLNNFLNCAFSTEKQLFVLSFSFRRTTAECKLYCSRLLRGTWGKRSDQSGIRNLENKEENTPHGKYFLIMTNEEDK